MTLYIVTRSSHYYPADGAGDWLAVFDNEEESRAFYAAQEPDDYETVWRIKVSPGEKPVELECK